MRTFLLLIAFFAYITTYASAAQNQSGENKTANPSAAQAKRKPQNSLNKNTATNETNKKTNSAPDGAILLNNEGVKLLNVQECVGAIAKFEEALRIDRHYGLARVNLATAYNDLGIKLKDDPKAAIKQFHKSLFCYPENPVTKQNLDMIIRSLMGKNPDSFKDRVELGDEAKRCGDTEGTVIEYQAALHLQKDSRVQKKLDDILQGIAKGVIKTSVPQRLPGEHDTQGFEFEPYIKECNRRITACGFDPKAINETKQVIVTCTIGRDGKVSNIHLDHTPAASGPDQESLKAVKKAAPFPPLPPGSPNSVDVQFTLEYKMHSVEQINGAPSNNAN